MKSYFKTETGDIIAIESKREYAHKQIKHNGTITTVGDTSHLEKSVMQHRAVGVLQANVS